MTNRIPHWVVRKVEYLEDYKLVVSFADGAEKVIDLKDELWGEVFEPLKDKEYFKNVYAEGTSIAWDNGADFAPEFLYEKGVDVETDKRKKSS